MTESVAACTDLLPPARDAPWQKEGKFGTLKDRLDPWTSSSVTTPSISWVSLRKIADSGSAICLYIYNKAMH